MTSVSGCYRVPVEDELGVVQPAQFIERRFVHMAGGDIRFDRGSAPHGPVLSGILLTGETYVAPCAESFSLSDVAGRGDPRFEPFTVVVPTPVVRLAK